MIKTKSDKFIEQEENKKKTEESLETKVIQIDRVARVVAGGRRFKFRATVVVGDKKGHVGIGVGKGNDVNKAINKATYYGKKSMIEVPIYKSTLPYSIKSKYGSAQVLLKPASPGTGLIAGGTVRAVLELAGVQDVLSKILGSANKINNLKATFLALKKIRDLYLKKQNLKK